MQSIFGRLASWHPGREWTEADEAERFALISAVDALELEYRVALERMERQQAQIAAYVNRIMILERQLGEAHEAKDRQSLWYGERYEALLQERNALRKCVAI